MLFLLTKTSTNRYVSDGRLPPSRLASFTLVRDVRRGPPFHHQCFTWSIVSPYFDGVEIDRWVRGKIIEVSPDSCYGPNVPEYKLARMYDDEHACPDSVEVFIGAEKSDEDDAITMKWKDLHVKLRRRNTSNVWKIATP